MQLAAIFDETCLVEGIDSSLLLRNDVKYWRQMQQGLIHPLNLEIEAGQCAEVTSQGVTSLMGSSICRSFVNH